MSYTTIPLRNILCRQHFPLLESEIQSLTLGSYPVIIIKQCEEESNTNFETRQADITGRNNNSTRKRLQVFLHIVLLPLSCGLFAVFDHALKEATIPLRKAKLSTALMYYYTHYGIFSMRPNFLSVR